MRESNEGEDRSVDASRRCREPHPSQALEEPRRNYLRRKPDWNAAVLVAGAGGFGWERNNTKHRVDLHSNHASFEVFRSGRSELGASAAAPRRRETE
jgi:hypothetical protein